MAGAFEAFVQQELPLRPFVPQDGAQESIAIRRGQGPRQMEFLQLEEGQVVVFKNGEITGVPIKGLDGSGPIGGVRNFVADIEIGSELATWTLAHNLNSFNCVAQVYQLNEDGSMQSVIPDSLKLLNANSVELKFSTPIAGKAILSFVD